MHIKTVLFQREIFKINKRENSPSSLALLFREKNNNNNVRSAKTQYFERKINKTKHKQPGQCGLVDECQSMNQEVTV